MKWWVTTPIFKVKRPKTEALKLLHKLKIFVVLYNDRNTLLLNFKAFGESIVQMLKLLRLILMINIQGYYMQFDVAIDRDVAAYMHNV